MLPLRADAAREVHSMHYRQYGVVVPTPYGYCRVTANVYPCQPLSRKISLCGYGPRCCCIVPKTACWCASFRSGNHEHGSTCPSTCPCR